tara:strand:- start:6627 stop:7754 length:1128 start_codon:yes stop_codon:yes gene_type:complete
MQFEANEQQRLLSATLNQFLSQRYDFAARIKASREKPGYRTDIWNSFANELGILGVGIAEEFGGTGGGPVEQMLVMEELGRALVIEPVAETVFQCGNLLARSGKADLLPKIIDGTVRIAMAVGEPLMRYDLSDIAATATRTSNGWQLSGKKSVVMTAPWATHFIIAARSSGAAGDIAGLSLFLVPADANGLTQHQYPTIDGRQAADLDLENIAIGEDALIGEVDQAMPMLEETRDWAIAAMAAEAAGLLDRLVSDTINYCKERKQFGQAISSFQTLQHRMVDMYMHVEMARSAALLANLKLDGDPLERSRAASAAKVTLANACRFVGQNAVQLHGGMGMTDELPIGHYFKRATVMESEHGTADWHLSRHAGLMSS